MQQLQYPLCTTGFYVAKQDYNSAMSAFYLFTINSMYIILASYLVLKVLRFPLINYANSRRRNFINRLVIFVSLVILIPSLVTFNGVLNESQFDSQAKEFLENELIGIPNYEFLKNTAQFKYNDDNVSSIVINTYGQKPLSQETINFLNKKLQKYNELKNAKLEFIQNDISLPNSNKFVNELRKRDSMELISKNNEINKLNQKLNDLESLSKEKLIFESLAKKLSIYPDLNQFEVFETIKTDFNQIDTVLVFNLRWNDELENQEKLKLNENVRSWLRFQLESDVFEIRSNSK